ncbi:MAG: TrkH family potassium uptake protein [Clostridia bacterium]|nr:TrkH family potassium uptake protein [Clostridia bacterium]
MNYRNVLSILGTVLLAEGILLSVPLLISLFSRDDCIPAFGFSALITIIIGLILSLAIKKTSDLTAKDGFIICGLSWIVLSLFGALPFFISGHINSYVDAVFETVSGLTTTGSSVISDVESLPKSLLFWRSFTHWIGGMGVLVFILAVLPLSQSRTMHLMKAEVPGPKVGKLVSKLRFTAQILYAIYIVLTIIEVLLLLIGGMPLFDSVVNSFATAGTGGFAIKNASIAAYNSPYFDGVITVFMVLFGINFNLYYLILLGDIKSVLKNRELHVYLGILILATAIIAVDIYSLYGSVFESIRYSSFQVASIMTTTGFATSDFNQWSNLSKTILVTLMFIGSCAGSTGGGIKVSRIMILIRNSAREIKRMIMPRAVMSVKIDGKPVENDTIAGAHSYLCVYLLIFFASVIILSVDQFDLTTNFTSVAACINNIGPGLSAVGPTGNFSAFSDVSKIVLIFDMLAGRLEIFPILMLFNISAWK